MTIRSGGSRSWRCNNPGNLVASAYSTSKSRRSIGTAGDKAHRHAVYPDYETGLEALIVMLKGSVYSPLTLRAAIERYDESNPQYIEAIVKITKLDPERTLNSLNDLEFETFWKAIELIEKWSIGAEDFIEKWIISGVHKKRGTIIEYLIQTSHGPTWFLKQDALKLAFEGRLHATIVHLKTGTYYLRPEYGSTPFECVT